MSTKCVLCFQNIRVYPGFPGTAYEAHVCNLKCHYIAFCLREKTRHRPPNETFKIQLSLVLYTFCTCCILRCLVCTVVSCLVCIVVVVLFVLLSSYVYLLYHVCIAVFTLDAGLLAISQYPEGPATGHLDTGFTWFPCVYKQMLRWFPRFPVATTCFSCSPPD